MKSLRINPIIALLSTLIVGGVFILSGILKIYSIDTFELYIYSFDIFDLNISSLLARVIIGAEFALGLGYATTLYHKELYRAIFASLVAFSIFLISQAIVGNNDNCHCFGDIVEFTPIESLIKNIALLALLLLSRETPTLQIRIKGIKWIFISLLAVLVLLPSIIIPHRVLYQALYQNRDGKKLDIELFNEFIAKNPQLKWGERVKIIALYGPSCRYCMVTSQQISQIITKNNLSPEGIHLLFWGNDEGVERFLNESESIAIDYTLLTPSEILNMCSGKVPTLILYDESNEHGVSIFGMRTLDEQEVIRRLSPRD